MCVWLLLFYFQDHSAHDARLHSVLLHHGATSAVLHRVDRLSHKVSSEKKLSPSKVSVYREQIEEATEHCRTFEEGRRLYKLLEESQEEEVTVGIELDATLELGSLNVLP